MEKIILLFILLTVPGAWAEANESEAESLYTMDSQSCEDTGQAAKPLSPSSDNHIYKISEKFSELTIESVTEENENEKEVGDIKSYSLTLYGKNAYLASPQFEGSNVNFFYVIVEEAPAKVQFYVNDFGGAQCGGGLVVSSLISKK